jgi:hypothetical protein
MNIVIERGKQVTLKSLPEYSIALDGMVQGPGIDTESHRYSFDHHAKCLRYCTTATCVQAWTAILGGLEPQKYTVYCNDVDTDVCAAIWCLKNPDRCTEPLVKKLIDAIGLGDMHAGAIPFNGMTKTVEWVSAPQTDSLRNGDYEKLSDDGLMTILESILHRITQYVNGEASIEIADQDIKSDFDIMRKENGWVLVESQDPHVYSQLYKSGFDRIILTRPQKDGTNAVSLAKRTDFIDNFPLEKIYKELNKLESGWGGSSTIGGAPRNEDGSRTSLGLDEIAEVVNACIDGKTLDIKKATKKRASKRSVKKS